MNDGFVNIKVDREERPDIDAVYMNATVALTGQGGWPMTCFLTPDGRPFFCGTYYPKPNFLQLLAAVSETWQNRRGEVEEASDRIADELRSMASGLPGGGPPIEPALCDHAVAAIAPGRGPRTRRIHHQSVWRTEVPAVGVAGGPAAQSRTHRVTCCRSRRSNGPVQRWRAAASTTSWQAGSPATASTQSWVVPHFEKMLYDNAQLLRAYAHWARRTSNPLARKVAGETARFMIDDLGADGMFTSSLDADADGREGLTYVWTPPSYAKFSETTTGVGLQSFSMSPMAEPSNTAARCCSCRTDPDDADRFERVRTALLAARLTRPQPGRDDKVVTAWNGLAITALAEASVALDEPEFLDRRNAMRTSHPRSAYRRRPIAAGQPRRSRRRERGHSGRPRRTGHRSADAVSTDGSRRPGWSAATSLLDIVLEHFADPQRPGRWYDTADDAEALMVRPADPLDGATPSGASLIAEALQLAAHLAPADRADTYASAAEATLAGAAPILARLARSGGHWLAVAEAAVRGPIQIAVACDPVASELLAAARTLAPGGAVVVGGPVNSSELLADRDRVAGADAAYVCRGRTCDLPVTTAGDLAAALGVSV